MGLVCTGAVVAATFLSINVLKDVNEPQLETMDMAEEQKTSKTYINSNLYNYRFCFCWFILFLFYICLMKFLNIYWWWNYEI